nr:hypothetical protein PJ912_20480 [Pectobacterium colocasium]
MKFNLLDDDLTLTTAFFSLKQQNLVVFQNGIAVGTEGRETQGFDVD